MALNHPHVHTHPMPPSPAPAATDSRQYQTNERSLLAWMRTGVSLIGLGFVVARFGLLLHQDHASIVRSAPRPFGVSLSSWLGTVIVVLAAVLVALSYARYGQIAHALDLGTYCDRRRLTTGLMLVVVLISIVLSIYLVVTG